jgi:hypothetical protein
MIDKRFWSGAIAVVTLIVAGASALPELLLRPASSGPTVVLSVSAPKAEPVVKSERTVARTAPVPIENRMAPVAPPDQSIVAEAPHPLVSVPDTPNPEPAASISAPVPSNAFPPVQPVGIAAASAPDVVKPANPPAAEGDAARSKVEKPPRPERIAGQAEKPKKAVRPAVYPIREFLAWRR